MGKNSRKKNFTAVLIVLFCLVLISGIKFCKSPNLSWLTFSPQPSHSQGSPQAPVKIIEYMDFQCPACAKGATILHETLKKNPSKFYLEAKYYPLEMHLHSLRAARYAECSARQGKFWEMYDLLSEQQSYWAGLLNPEPVFSEMVKKIGLDPKKIEQCLADPKLNDLIYKSRDEGKAREVKSTPTFFVNGKMIVGTVNLEKEIKSALDIPGKPLIPGQK